MIKRHINIIKLIGYFIIIPIIIWNLTIGKSFDLWSECENNKDKLFKLQCDRENKDKDNNRIELSDKGYLLDSISINKNIKVIKYGRFITASINDYSLITNVLVVSGDYFKLLKTIYQLEKTWTINSLTFQTEMNYKTKQTSLYSTIITQEILKIN
ncbi:MAG: hypothetical protein IMY73_04570 [Bacteroidetes bacterium]|nr:hypothetical protein [Bacteroidota bacterium]